MRLGKKLFLPSDFKAKYNGRKLRENLILLLANNKGTDQTAMMAKPTYLSVNPTSGIISIPKLVFVAEQTGLSNTWPQPQYLCQHACVSALHANCCYMYLQTFILTSFKNIFHVSDRVRVHVYVIISSSLKPYQNFGPDMSPACLLMFSVDMIKETDNFKTDHGYSNR